MMRICIGTVLRCRIRTHGFINVAKQKIVTRFIALLDKLDNMGPLLGPRIVEIKLDHFRSGEGWRRGSTESYRNSVSGKLVKGALGVCEGREERKCWLWRRLEAGGHSSNCGETCEIFLRETFALYNRRGDSTYGSGCRCSAYKCSREEANKFEGACCGGSFPSRLIFWQVEFQGVSDI